MESYTILECYRRHTFYSPKPAPGKSQASASIYEHVDKNKREIKKISECSRNTGSVGNDGHIGDDAVKTVRKRLSPTRLDICLEYEYICV